MLGFRVWRVARLLAILGALAPLAVLPVTPVLGQAVSPGGGAAVSFKVLADQVLAFFPVIQTELVEVTGDRVTLASGRSEGMQPGVDLTAFREGRELHHPTTKKLLGRTEERLGRVVVVEVFENYSVARQVDGGALQPGDKARVTAGKVPLTVLALGSGPRPRLMEAATGELVQELERTGRFQLVLGDPIAAWLHQEQIPVEEFMNGRGVARAAERFRVANLLALRYTTVDSRPYVEARLFSGSFQSAGLATALFVPASVRPRPEQEFSTATAAGAVKVERRSLLARLLSGDFEPNQYSAGATSIPIKQLATFPFIVTSMDVAVSPHDNLPRIAVTDGQRVFLYRLNNQVLEPEWTHDRRLVGRILNVQLADLNGDGGLEVVVNRQDAKVGMLSYVLTTREGGPGVVADDIPILLLAVDERGDGVKRTLLGQKYNEQTFFTKGNATRYVVQDRDVAPDGTVVVHDTFRAMGATYSNIGGKEGRVLAFVDEHNRLKLVNGGQELWRSLTIVGGGLPLGIVQVFMHRTLVERPVKIEPNPVAVDLDGDGIEEIVVPVNQDEAGRMAVVFRGPAGYRMQVVNSGFEGMVTGIGAVAGDGGPSLIAAVAKRVGFLSIQGDSQLLMTVPE